MAKQKANEEVRKYRYAGAGEIAAMQGQVNDSDMGIPCKVCGCRHHQTLETRPAPKNQIRRRRQCRNCGLRFTTYEDMS